MTASDDVLDLVQQQNDAGLLEGLLAGDFAGAGPLGLVLGREQWLARFANVHVGPLQIPARPPQSA